MTISKTILQRIETFAEGEIFTTSKFFDFGTRNAIDQILFRLEKRDVITRVARGIYMRPKTNRFVSKVLPSSFEVAQKLAEMTGSIVQVNGAEAARQFGLTTQVPTQPIFWTNGQSRRFHMGKLTVILRHVAPRKLACAGSIAGLALTALWYLGKEYVRAETFALIKNQMTTEEYQQFKSSMSNMPIWLVNAIQQYETEHAKA